MDFELPVYVIHYVSNNTNIIFYLTFWIYIAYCMIIIFLANCHHHPPQHQSLLPQMMMIPIGMDLELPVYDIHYVSNNTNIIIILFRTTYLTLTIYIAFCIKIISNSFITTCPRAASVTVLLCNICLC